MYENIQEYVELWDVSGPSGFTRTELEMFTNEIKKYFILDPLWLNIRTKLTTGAVVNVPISSWNITRIYDTPDFPYIYVPGNTGVRGVYYDNYTKVIVAPIILEVNSIVGNKMISLPMIDE